jgi:hypothetical protein
MQNLDVSKTVYTWSSLADTVFAPRTEAEYRLLCLELSNLGSQTREDFLRHEKNKSIRMPDPIPTCMPDPNTHVL